MLTTSTSHPVVIQGGMGVNISSWQLAREVARKGQLGVVSGTALDCVLARGLQDGDQDGHLRRALAAFPDQQMAERVLTTYFVDGGRPKNTPYRPNPTMTVTPSTAALELSVLGNFVHVWLAKEGHDGLIGINCLEKIQMANPSALLGAMIADVDYVLMGAGIPREIPRLLRDFADGRSGSISIDVTGGEPSTMTLDPRELLGKRLPSLRRPQFLAIISLHSLASYLHRDEEIRPDGFVVEGPSAGGHSAPPRGRMQLDDDGQPVYSDRDLADLSAIARIGLPFWLAGAYSTPEQLQRARQAGAAGIQCGTVFALANESGLAPSLRRQLLASLADGTLQVRNDPLASPTGFPFKVAQLTDSLSVEEVYQERPRLCDLSYLREPYRRPDGSIGYRCASEPVDAYLRKGGARESTLGRKCLCNALMVNAGLGQVRKDGYAEQPAVTLGQDLEGPRRLLARHPQGWGAREVIDWLMCAVTADSVA